VFATLARLGAAAVLAGVPALLAVIGLSALLGEGGLGSLAQLIVGGAVLVVAYVGIALLLRVREIQELGNMLRSRVGR
jgi:putative peptidoglycan lipid II flippase